RSCPTRRSSDPHGPGLQRRGPGLREPPNSPASWSSPPEGPLPPGPSHSDEQRPEKQKHLHHRRDPYLGYNHCPRIHEQHLHVEGEEDDRSEVPARMEPG